MVVVTGVTGFVASWVAFTCLKAGFRVRGTVRSLKEQDRFVHLAKDFCPKTLGAKHTIKLVEADLLNPDDWDVAMLGATYCIHVASPVPLLEPRDKDEVIRPAVEGTLNVLGACARSKTVKRVVMTSSAAAVAYGRGPADGVEFTDESWTVMDDPNFPLGSYEESKTRAEMAAWEFIKEKLPADCTLDLCTIMPTFIVGNVFSKNMNSSANLVLQVLLGKMVLLPDITIDCVSIEDVARAHVLALVTPEAGGKRMLLHGGQLSLQDLGRLFKKEFGNKGYKPTSWIAPTWAVKFAAYFDEGAKALLSSLGAKKVWKMANCYDVLKMQPLNSDMAQSFLDMVYGLVRVGVVEDKSVHFRSKDRRLDHEIIDRMPGSSLSVTDITEKLAL